MQLVSSQLHPMGKEPMRRRTFFALSIVLAVIATLCNGFGRISTVGTRLFNSKVRRSSCGSISGERPQLRMATLDDPPVKETAKILVMNAYQSPSIQLLQKDTKGKNPADSPACQVNGGKTDTSINPYDSPSVQMLVRKSTSDTDALKSPCVKYLGINKEAIKNAMSSPSLQFTSEARTAKDMPLSLVVGQESIKTALILLAVNPRIGGLVIAGGKGTGKSVMARALHRVMPPIEVVKGSSYNISPDADASELDDFTRKELEISGKKLTDMETEIITCPFVQVPVNVMEDRLFGSVDVKKTLELGETVFTPGLLAEAHRGMLYVDDVNLLDTDLTTMMLQAISDGFAIVEREGISVKYPCKPVMIATLNPEDSELKDSFLDRIGMALNADTEPLTMQERVEAVNQVNDFVQGEISQEKLNSIYEKEEQLKSTIVFAREYLKETKVSKEQLSYLCEEAARGGCEGHRAELCAARVAIASAALEDAPVRADDLRLAVKLAIVPRSRFQLPAQDEEMMPPPPPPPSSAPQPEQNVDQENSNDDDEEKEEEEDKDDDKEEDEEDDEEEMGEPSVPEEFMFEAENVALEDDMMKFTGKQKAGKGGKSGIITSRDRGRYLRPVTPKPGQPLRVAIDATLREAAKHQVQRRAAAAAEGKDPTRIYLEGSDVRGKLMARKAGSLLIFAVDASGSMALNRMNAAKGAAVGLLTEAYQSRDKVALIPFQGSTADVLLPPTRSISMAKNRLDSMPCGGGSPLAHALTQAVRTGVNAMAQGDVGRCVVVLISDGRANVPLDVSLSESGEGTAEPLLDAEGNVRKPTDAEKKEMRVKLKEEVLTIAKNMREMSSFKLLVIDTENKFVSTGMAKEIAEAAGGRYHFIPKASANAMQQVAAQAVASLKAEQRSR